LPTAARAKALEWASAVTQVQDLRRRDEGVAAIRVALTSADGADRLAALWALPMTHSVAYDKESLRPLVVPLLDAERPEERVAALDALWTVKTDPSDLDRVLALGDDPAPEVRERLVRMLSVIGRGEFRPDAEALAQRLLGDPNPRVARQALHGLGAARLTPALEARVLEIARRDEESAKDVTYFVLGNTPNKSEAVVDLLMERAQMSDASAASRALWSLDRGVVPEMRAKVAAFGLRMVETRTGSMREQAMRVVAGNADASLVPDLERYAALPGHDEHTRSEVLRLVERIRRSSKR
jgi:hypothetical protein